ncbi:uncharacterized protein EI97DRAFT_420329 [Westerdykella ornata]|uniref:Homeobox domain-containing protein n=1 Tax=Westerdykella ornata TaxID=318751 RepID=A0A6A6JG95_WESOR|nr:uncharacterized protein EI97DRAFT_420329 [Westerdykella ornata]KAF2275357.1 hypothetical protein EI97DRAFT_420329 [Westerdykella ornata]
MSTYDRPVCGVLSEPRMTSSHTMTDEPQGSIDEFFDFARLEADMSNGCQLQPFHNGGAFQHVYPDCAPMDWEPPEAETDTTPVAIPSELCPDVYCAEETIGNTSLNISLVGGFTGGTDCFTRDGVFQCAPDREFEQHMPITQVLQSPTIAPRCQVLDEPPSSAQNKTQRKTRQSGYIQRKPASAKHKGPSNRISLEAKQMLEEEFAANPYPCAWEIDIIAHQVNLDAKRVRTWFNNARARKKPNDDSKVKRSNASIRSVTSQLSAESLEALSKQINENMSPQPPLAVYLASSYLEEAADLTDIQAAIGAAPSSERSDFFMDSSSGSRAGRSGSIITSLTSSEGSAPTSFTMSSRGSNTSSFGRERRRGRRRMAWRNSPYSRPKIDGLNDAGQPSRNLPFFCTFCPRAFKTKYEWIRHEDSVHALRTTWICCSNKQEPMEKCPFCGIADPDEVHLATHKYQQCKNKPESHRTFYRRDHFIQHLHHVHFGNVKHPSAKLGCGTREQGSQQQDFGCKELALKWRHFGAPMRPGDPMLHCGFCGQTLSDWGSRCEHVAQHLAAGGWDRSAWWPERKENHMENRCTAQEAGPFRCRYCAKVFENVGARDKHTHCRVWSCRFLRTFDDVASENSGPPLCPQFPSPKAHHCHLCGAGYRSCHGEHAQLYHKYRLCKQELYTSKDDFLQHLHEFHGASDPLLLSHNPVLEQHFSRNKGAAFETLEFDEILQGCRVSTPAESFVDPCTEEAMWASTLSPEEIVEWTQTVRTPSTDVSSDHCEKANVAPSARRRHSTKQILSKIASSGPRFFRLEPILPFLSSRIYYMRNAKTAEMFGDGEALLTEVGHGHIASLVMSSGLVGMAGVRMPVQLKKDRDKNLVELSLGE